MSKKFVASAVLVALMFIAMYGVSLPNVEADSDSDSVDFIKELSDKFNLEEEEISSFMSDIRSDRFAQMQDSFADHLALAVEKGDLSDEHMNEILDMHGMHIAEMDSYVNLSVDGRHEMMQEHHDNMKIWADENGVDFELIY